jgi:hypothetical protein
MSAADTIKYCGTAGALGLLKMIALTGFGIISISIALVAVGAAFLIPELRNPRWWLWSVAALSLFAVADVAEAHARFPTPSNPAFCDF